MSDLVTGLRRATEDEIVAEMATNPTDFWQQVYLDMRPEVVGRAARRLWGPPVSGGTPGETLWKLWSSALDAPVYIAVGVLRPAALFSGGMLPSQDDAEGLVGEIREMLREAEGDQQDG